VNTPLTFVRRLDKKLFFVSMGLKAKDFKNYIPCGPAMLSRRKLYGDHLRVVSWWSLDFLAKSLVILSIYTKFKLIAHKFNVYMAGITIDLAKKSGDHPQVVSGWSPDDNIAGPHNIPIKL
jgi:hypothetical protein